MRIPCAILLTGAILALCGCGRPLAYNPPDQAEAKYREAAWAEAARAQAEDTARREKAWAEADAQLKKQDEMLRRQEALLAKQEEQARRFDSILDKWESMTPRKSE